MKELKLIFGMVSLLYLLNGCFNKGNSEIPQGNTNKMDYIKMLEELHEIECSHLQKEKISLNDTSVYSIRSIAFQAVMKNKDRKVLARYEDLYQKLADIKHAMGDEQKIQYEIETKKIYQTPCQ